MKKASVVPVRDLAVEWGIHSSGARMYILAQGVKPALLRDPSRRGQKILVVTLSQAKDLRQKRKAESL